jgi:hypothetical protein
MSNCRKNSNKYEIKGAKVVDGFQTEFFKTKVIWCRLKYFLKVIDLDVCIFLLYMVS